MGQFSRSPKDTKVKTLPNRTLQAVSALMVIKNGCDSSKVIWTNYVPIIQVAIYQIVGYIPTATKHGKDLVNKETLTRGVPPFRGIPIGKMAASL
jgi:hypothetical protein